MALLGGENEGLLRAGLLGRRARLALDVAAVGAHVPGAAVVVELRVEDGAQGSRRSGSSTGTTTSTRLSRLRFITSAEPM